MNLNEDPLMSECLLYYIKDGITRLVPIKAYYFLHCAHKSRILLFSGFSTKTKVSDMLLCSGWGERMPAEDRTLF